MIQRFKIKSDFIKNILALATGTSIAQFIPILISPILTRIYTPEDFGLFALFIAVTVIFGSIANGKYETAIMLPKKDEDAINLFALGLIITFSVSILLLILIIFLNQYFANMLSNNEFRQWLYFVPLGVFLIGLWSLLNFFSNRIKKYKQIKNVTILKSIVLATLQISISYFKSGVTGLIGGQLVSQLLGNILLLKNIIKNRVLISKISTSRIIALAKKFKNFPKFSSPHTLINVFFSNLPIFLLGGYFSSIAVGMYALALRISRVPAKLISQAISNVLFQRIVSYKNKNLPYMKYVFKFLIIQILLGLLVSISLLFISNYTGLILGEKWTNLGSYLLALIPWITTAFIVSPLSFSIALGNQQKKGLYVEIIYGFLKFISLVVGIYIGDIIITLWIFSISNSIFIFLQGCWYLSLLKMNDINEE